MFSSKKPPKKSSEPQHFHYFFLIKSTLYPHTEEQRRQLVMGNIFKGAGFAPVTYFKSQEDLVACIEALQKLNGVNTPQPSDDNALRRMEYYYIACIEVDPTEIGEKKIEKPRSDLENESRAKVSGLKYKGKMLSLQFIFKDERIQETLKLRKKKKSYLSLLPEDVLNLTATYVSKPSSKIKVISLSLIPGQKLEELDKNRIRVMTSKAIAHKPAP